MKPKTRGVRAHYVAELMGMVIVVLALGLQFVLSGCGGASDVEARGTRYENPDLGFSMVIPPDWEEPDLSTRNDPNNVGWKFGLSAMFLEDDGATPRGNVEVSSRSAPDDLTIEEVFVADRSVARSEGLSLSEPEYLSIGDMRAVRFSMDRVDNGTPVRLLKFSALDDERLYHVSFICKKADADTLFPMYDSVARTLRAE